MKLIDRVEADYESGKQTVEVPGWGVDGGPEALSFTATTVEDESKALFACTDKSDKMEFFVRLIILKATNSEGKKAFAQDDKDALMKKAKNGKIAMLIDALGAESVEGKKPSSGETPVS